MVYANILSIGTCAVLRTRKLDRYVKRARKLVSDKLTCIGRLVKGK
jgi:hypothetical protein